MKKGTKFVQFQQKNLPKNGTFPQNVSFFAKSKTGRFAKTVHIWATKNKTLSNFAVKRDISTKCLGFSPNPKLVVSRKLKFSLFVRDELWCLPQTCRRARWVPMRRWAAAAGWAWCDVSPAPSSEPLEIFFYIIFRGDFFFFLLYSTLLSLPPLRFHRADDCWDRTQDRCNWCIGSRTLYNH